MDLKKEIRTNETTLTSNGGFSRLFKLGIPASAFVRCGSIGIAKVQVLANRSFRPNDKGVWMLVHPIPSILPFRTSIDIENQTRDLIAYDPKFPECWYRRTGHEKILGWHSLVHSALDTVPVQFHDTPLQWLKSGGTGVVILDKLPFELSGFSIGRGSYFSPKLVANIVQLGL